MHISVANPLAPTSPNEYPTPRSNHSRRPSGNHKKIYSVTKFKLTRTNKKKHTGGKKPLLFYSRRCNLISLIASGDVCKEGSATNVIRFASLLLQLLFIFPVGFSQSCRHTLMSWGNCKRLMDYANFCLLLKMG